RILQHGGPVVPRQSRPVGSSCRPPVGSEEHRSFRRRQDLFHKMIPMAGTAECRWAINKSMSAQCLKKAEQLGVEEWKNTKEV
ncbi:hypothetical protein PFISCL1PPCAC_11050, partial [Pristionchus fissidentatus]